MRKFLTLVAALVIVALGAAAAAYFVMTKPRAQKKPPPRMTPVVHVTPVTAGVHRVSLDLMGTVIAAREVDLKAQVSGRIATTHPDWIEGGRLSAGDVVVGVEEDDYRIRLAQARSNLELAKNDLALEMGRQDIARREWDMLGQGGSELESQLPLRMPQLKSARARVESATSEVKKAQLDLDRTLIRAPFDSLVLSRGLQHGDLASTQTSIGRLVATDRYHVQVSIPVDWLRWVELPGENGEGGAAATIELEDGDIRSGRVIKLLGDLEPQGRMARLLVSIENPLNGSSAVLLGSFVNVRVDGSVVEDSYEIDRDHYREGGEIWLLRPNKTLRILKIDPIFADRDRVIFRADIARSERLIASDLSSPVEAMKLRLVGEAEADPAADADSAPSQGRKAPSGGESR